MYCSQEISDAKGKSCRMIVAHEKEKAANQNSESRKKYSRIYNNLKAHFVEGRISKEEYIQQPDAL